jgi:hypothetical protein
MCLNMIFHRLIVKFIVNSLSVGGEKKSLPCCQQIFYKEDVMAIKVK